MLTKPLHNSIQTTLPLPIRLPPTFGSNCQQLLENNACLIIIFVASYKVTTLQCCHTQLCQLLDQPQPPLHLVATEVFFFFATRAKMPPWHNVHHPEHTATCNSTATSFWLQLPRASGQQYLFDCHFLWQCTKSPLCNAATHNDNNFAAHQSYHCTL